MIPSRIGASTFRLPNVDDAHRVHQGNDKNPASGAAAASSREDGGTAQPQSHRRVRRGVSNYTPDQIAKYTPDQIAAIPPEDFRHLSKQVVSTIPLEAIARLKGEQLSKLPLEGYRGFTSQQVERLDPGIFSQLSNDAFQEIFGASTPLENITSREVSMVSALNEKQIARLPPQHFENVLDWFVSTLQPKTLLGLTTEQFLKIPEKKAFRLEQISYLDAGIFSRISEGEFRDLLLGWSERNSAGLTRKQITQIPATYFQCFNGVAIQNLKSEVVSDLSVEQFVNIRGRDNETGMFGGIHGFTAQQIPHLRPEIFSKMSENIFLELFHYDRGVYSQVLQGSVSEAHIRARIQALTQAQIGALTYQSLNSATEFFYANLTDDQLRWINPRQIRWVPLRVFSRADLVQRFFHIWNEEHIQGMTRNQLRHILPVVLRQVQLGYQALGGKKLQERLTRTQLNSLTQAQVIQLQPGLPQHTNTHRYAVLYYSELDRSEIQRIPSEDISTIHAEVLRQLGVDFLGKLTLDQFIRLIPEQRALFDAADLLNLHQQLGRRQPETLRRIGIRNLNPNQIPELGNTPTSFDPGEIRALGPEYLESMTPQQIGQQGAKFFNSLSFEQIRHLRPDQFRAIDPQVFASPQMEDFLEKLIPIQANELMVRDQWLTILNQQKQNMRIHDRMALQRTQQQRDQKIQQLQNEQSLTPRQTEQLEALHGFERYRIYLAGLQQNHENPPPPFLEDFQRVQLQWRRVYRFVLAHAPHIQNPQQHPLTAEQQAERIWWQQYNSLRKSRGFTQFPLESLTEQEYTNRVRNLTNEQIKNLPVHVYQTLGEDFLLRLNPEVLSSVPEKVFLGVGEHFVRNLPLASVKYLTAPQVVHLGKSHLLRYFTGEQVLQLHPECFARLSLPMLYTLPSPMDWSAEQIAKLPPEYFKHIYDFSSEATQRVFLDAFSRVAFHMESYPVHLEKRIDVLPPAVFSLLKAPHLNKLSLRAIRSITHEQIKQIPLDTVKELSFLFWNQLLVRQLQWFSIAQRRNIPSDTLRQMDHTVRARLETLKILTQEGLDALKAPPAKRLRVEPNTLEKVVSPNERSHIALLIESVDQGDRERVMSQQALENYWMKRPTMEAYKMTYQRNQRWEWQKYDPESKEWRSHDGHIPYQAIGKLEVIAHGINGQIAGVSELTIISEYKKAFAPVQPQGLVKIKRLNLNVCKIGPQVGERFAEEFLTGPTVIESVAGTHYRLYVTGNEEGTSSGESTLPAGHRIYEVGKELWHGVDEGRWLVRYNDHTRGLVTTQYKTAKNRIGGRVVHPAPEHAGPFDFRIRNDDEISEALKAAWHLQRLSESQKNPNLSDADFKAIAASYEAAQAMQAEKREVQRIDVLSRDYKSLNRDILKLAGEFADGESFFIPRKGGREVTIYDSATNKNRVMSIEDEAIKRRLGVYEEIYNKSMEGLREVAPYLESNDRGELTFKSGMLNSLRAAYQTRGGKAMLGFSSGIFGVRAWASYLTKQNSEDPLPLGLQVAAYWNLADATAGMSDDAVRGVKAVAQVFARRGTTLAEGAVKVLRSAGGALRAVNLGFTAGSLAFDIHLLATAKDEETRAQAGISLGMTLASLGVTVMAGPVAALPVIALSLLASWVVGAILDTKRIVKHYQDQSDQGREILANFRKLFSQEFKDGVLTLQGIPILEVDAQNKKIIINSPVIQKLERVLRPDGTSAANGSLYSYILSQEKLLTEALNLPPLISLKEEDVKKVVILPESTYQRKFVIAEDEIYPSLPFLGRGTSLYDPAQPEHQVLEDQLKSNGVISSPIRSVKETTPDAAALEKPIKIKASPSGPSVWIIPPQAGQNKARYSFEASAEGGEMVMINNLHEGVHLTLKDTGGIPSLFCINVPEADLSERDQLKIKEQDGKQIFSIQYHNGSSARIDISELGSSPIRVIGKRGTWNIYPNKNIVLQRMAFSAPIAEIQDYLEDLPKEWKESEVKIELLPKTPLPDSPVPPKTVKTVTKRQLAPDGWVEITTKTTTTPTTTTIETTTIHPITAYTGMQRNPVTTTQEVVATPEDDPIHLQAKAEWNAYLNKLKEYYQKEITATHYINAPVDAYGKGRLIYHRDLLPGAKIVESTTSDYFFFQAGRGTLQRIKDFTNEEIRCQLPISDPQSQIKNVRVDGNQILFTHVVPYGKQGKALEFSYQWEANGPLKLKGVDGLRMIQGAVPAITGRYSPEEEELLKRAGLIDIQSGQEFSGWVELRNDTKSKEYLSCEGGSKTLVVEEDYQLERVLSHPQKEEMRVIFYSAKQQAVLLVTVPKNELVFIDARKTHASVRKIETIEAVHSQGGTEMVLIEEEGKQLRRLNPFTNQSTRIPVSPMGESIEMQQSGPVLDLEKLREDYSLNFFNLFYLPGSSVEFAEREGEQIRIGQRLDYRGEGASVLFNYLFVGEESALEAVRYLPEDLYHQIQEKLKRARSMRTSQGALAIVLEVLGLGDYTKSSRFPPKMVPWLKIEGPRASYVNTEDLREIPVPKEAILIQSDEKTLVWNSQTKELFLMPNTGQALIPLLNGTKVELFTDRKGSVSWITVDGKEIFRGIDQNGEAQEKLIDIHISQSMPSSGEIALRLQNMGV